MDVVTAFLNADIKEDVYIKQPQGFDNGTGKVCKLMKCLYGTRQASHEWNIDLNDFIVSIGFTRCITDTCVYIKISRTGKLIIITIFVDDITSGYAKEDEAEWNEIKSAFMNRFKMKDLGDAKWLLGMEIKRNREERTMEINQSLYLKTVLERFGMLESKSERTPEVTGNKLSKQQSPTTEEQKLEMKNIPYRQAVGSLLYASIGTRPDIAHAVNSVSRYLENPGMEHWKAVKRILRYIRGSLDVGLVFKSNNKTHEMKYEMNVYSDADWGGDRDDRKSTTGFVVKLNGNCVSWTSKKQSTVALSSAEAEYLAIGSAAKETKWLTQFLGELQIQSSTKTIIYTDNRAAKLICKNDLYHDRTKHIDIRHHSIRNDVKNGVYNVEWISTYEQLGDIFTKGLNVNQFTYLRDKIMTMC
jgi:hypothetical protein